MNNVDRVILQVLTQAKRELRVLDIYHCACAYPIPFLWFTRKIQFREVRPSLQRLEKAGLIESRVIKFFPSGAESSRVYQAVSLGESFDV